MNSDFPVLNGAYSPAPQADNLIRTIDPDFGVGIDIPCFFESNNNFIMEEK